MILTPSHIKLTTSWVEPGSWAPFIPGMSATIHTKHIKDILLWKQQRKVKFSNIKSQQCQRGMYLHLPKAVNGVNLYSKLNIYIFVKKTQVFCLSDCFYFSFYFIS